MARPEREDAIREARVALEFMCYYNERRELPVYGRKIKEVKGRVVPDVALMRECDDEIVAYLEIKCRQRFTRSFMEREGGLVIPEYKYMGLKEGGERNKRPVLLVCALKDVWVWHDVMSDPIETKLFTGKERHPEGGEFDLTKRHVFFDPATMRPWYTPDPKDAFFWPDQSLHQWVMDYEEENRNANRYS